MTLLELALAVAGLVAILALSVAAVVVSSPLDGEGWPRRPCSPPDPRPRGKEPAD